MIISAIDLIRKRTAKYLDEHIHVALTDHILFAINRLMKGLAIKNPFNEENPTEYKWRKYYILREYEVANEVVDLINEMTNIELPIGEVGFIACIFTVQLRVKIFRKLIKKGKSSQLIAQLVHTIEEQFEIKLNKNEIIICVSFDIYVYTPLKGF